MGVRADSRKALTTLTEEPAGKSYMSRLERLDALVEETCDNTEELLKECEMQQQQPTVQMPVLNQMQQHPAAGQCHVQYVILQQPISQPPEWQCSSQNGMGVNVALPPAALQIQ